MTNEHKKDCSSKRSAFKASSMPSQGPADEPASLVPNQMPSRPLNAYNFFVREQLAIITAEDEDEVNLNDAARFKKNGKAIAERWKTLRPAEHARFCDLAAAEQERYRREMNDYNAEIFRQMQHEEAPAWRQVTHEDGVDVKACPAPQQSSVKSSQGEAIDAALDSDTALDSEASLQEPSSTSEARGRCSRANMQEALDEYAATPAEDSAAFGPTARLSSDVALPCRVATLDMPYQVFQSPDSGSLHSELRQHLECAADSQLNLASGPELVSNEEALRLIRSNKGQLVCHPQSIVPPEYDTNLLGAASHQPVTSDSLSNATMSNQQASLVATQATMVPEIAATLSLLLRLHCEASAQRETPLVPSPANSAEPAAAAPDAAPDAAENTIQHSYPSLDGARPVSANSEFLSNQSLVSAESNTSQQIVPSRIQELMLLALSLQPPPS